MSLDATDGSFAVPSYAPFPPFERWSTDFEGRQELDNYVSAYIREAAAAGVEERARVAYILGREAAAETGAVEDLYELPPGATRTIVSESPGWESLLGSRNGAQLFADQLDTYERIRQTAEESDEYIVIPAFIRELHKVACRSQRTYLGHILDPAGRFVPVELPLHHGEYKTGENHVLTRTGTSFAYAPVIDVGPEMERLCDALNSESFLGAHRVIQAAFAHYSFVRVHPFSDGNGRVARALASYYTYKHVGLPLIVYSDRKLTYRQALESADNGDYRRFNSYIADLMIDALGRARQELRSINARTTEKIQSEIDALLLATGGLTVEDAWKVAARLRTLLVDRLNARLSVSQSGRDEYLEVDVSVSTQEPVEGMAGYGGSSPVYIRAKLTKGAEVWVRTKLAVLVASDLSSRFTFCLVRDLVYHPRNTASETVFLRYDDVSPSIGVGASAKVELFVESTISDLYSRLLVELRKALRQAGHEPPS